ncbi:hypothetical protein L873DRAFT_1813726 [Choiromyces venosus 120613-1]|uniref:Uncharacterized protein n=1 Tax=Choiromyces venosus 120613-1 TaxID=1336337 RepID=A0A3N4J9E0_9PEZI|nr:hypothetical protein L873DRAFT_1813726 [Choiromyces venosus 120613-1]
MTPPLLHLHFRPGLQITMSSALLPHRPSNPAKLRWHIIIILTNLRQATNKRKTYKPPDGHLRRRIRPHLAHPPKPEQTPPQPQPTISLL